MQNQTRRNVIKLASATGISLAGLSWVDTSQAAPDSNSDEKVVRDSTHSRSDEPIHGIRLEQSFAYVESPQYKVAAPEGKQYVFANVSSSLPRNKLKLIVDEKEYAGGHRISGLDVDAVVIAEADGVERLAGWELPAGIDATAAEIVLEDQGDTTLAKFSDELVNDLSKLPEFKIVDFGLPATGKVEVDIPIPVMVENTGDREGTFFALLNREDRTSGRYLGVTVPAGGQATWNGVKKYGPYSPTGETKFTFTLDWGKDTKSKAINVPR